MVNRGVEIKERAGDAGPCGRLGGVEIFVDLCVTHTEELLRRSGVGLELRELFIQELAQDLRLLLARVTRRAEAEPVGETFRDLPRASSNRERDGSLPGP